MNLSYDDALKFLFGLERFGWKLGLERVEALLASLGNPQKQFASVHIAGTNGKGSTAAMLESVLRQGGYRTGLYTSPHLVDATERIKVNGQDISREDLGRLTARLRPGIEEFHCTFFEAMTAIAFLYFAEQGVQIAVVETGLGGRLDATNVLRPLLTIITEIGLDHTEHLGPTLEDIAREKAGIIKQGVPCLAGSRNRKVLKILREICDEKNAEFIPVFERYHPMSRRLREEGTLFDVTFGLHHWQELSLPLVGKHQVDNATIAIAAANALNDQSYKLSYERLHWGLAMVHWPGRLQKLQEAPKVILDVAHNPDGMQTVREALERIYDYDRLFLLLGVLADKDYRSMVKTMMPLVDTLVCVRPPSERALDPRTLAQAAAQSGRRFGRRSAQANPIIQVIENLSEGYHWLLRRAVPEDLICITGSHYVVGEILKIADSYPKLR